MLVSISWMREVMECVIRQLMNYPISPSGTYYDSLIVLSFSYWEGLRFDGLAKVTMLSYTFGLVLTKQSLLLPVWIKPSR